MGPKYNMNGVLTRRRNLDIEAQTHTGRRACEDRGKDWRDVSTRQETARMPAQPEAGSGKKVLWKSAALPTPWFSSSSLQNCERMHFCCLKPSVLR